MQELLDDATAYVSPLKEQQAVTCHSEEVRLLQASPL
jgi:hypothetical protein